MKKRFMVTDSSNPEFRRQVFEIQTEIKQMVDLPFTDEQYRCFMFNGIQVRLVKDDEYIIGELF